jgi:succinate dehydrogenase/fumarate reductase flavoprotein subunit
VTWTDIHWSNGMDSPLPAASCSAIAQGIPTATPIPRLYSAGEFGSIWGYLYQGATNITECLVFGQIAGRNAAAS